MTTYRLLIVDDNPDYRLLVRYALEGSVIDVVGEAASIDAGVRAAKDLVPDAVLLDVVLQGSDGLLGVRPLQEAAPRAAIIAAASYAEHELWGESPHLDQIAYISKGTPPTRLCDELVRVLETARAVSDVLATERQRFPAELLSARAARKFVAGVLEEWSCADLEDSVQLLVSELVTNAVVHAQSDVEVVLHLREDRVRVEVIDAAAEYVHRRDAGDDEQSGRGMALTEALAVAWGIDTLLAGKSVWFEVSRETEAVG
jgi:DNA-binding NarL/FixJ family response regulator